ncbi:RagB/SusD family nutrient uptake outer membrane protein [Carboxylicivirga marina]|uniref:RagB/SusD family nutrient uptake outer membrane protein n=1 Tax=Carboxylicivirga marina TaxID=2800988 RepID=A0ABS1HDU3_9BACT|nr:RagB/SusD family nutrient uptake outer membrane protein [Carboxylicivirga marina]MBK3515845.1 RagB/SusD family nutrient uptake outer membrane protein [Carboxylicivirga marina]
MNKLIIYSIALFSVVAASCSDWLDVKPRSQTSVSEMFASENGFTDAMTGVYINLTSRKLYGQTLTMKEIEYLAQHWDLGGTTTENAFLTYDYNSSQILASTDLVFSLMYNNIANINSILEHIDENKDVFTLGMYEMVKGEALALRAFCHFELLRLFGPVPTLIKEGKVLPYVKTISKDVHAYHSYQEYIQYIEEDFKNAEQLLSQVDPIHDFSVEDLNDPLSQGINNLHQGYRKYKMNYFAVKGVMARFYLWTQNKQKAYEYAMHVIQAQNPDGSYKYNLGTKDDLDRYDRTLSKEHLWSLSAYDLQSNVESLFLTGVLKQHDYIISYVFDRNLTDIRYEYLWKTVVDTRGNESFTIMKYFLEEDVAEDQPSTQKQIIPLLRLSEMYLIAIECSELTESSTLYKEYAGSRNLIANDFINEQDRQDILIKEYRKEFYGEGQMFYAYKRLMADRIFLYRSPATEETYVVPLPAREIGMIEN